MWREMEKWQFWNVACVLVNLHSSSGVYLLEPWLVLKWKVKNRKAQSRNVLRLEAGGLRTWAGGSYRYWGRLWFILSSKLTLDLPSEWSSLQIKLSFRKGAEDTFLWAGVLKDCLVKGRDWYSVNGWIRAVASSEPRFSMKKWRGTEMVMIMFDI